MSETVKTSKSSEFVSLSEAYLQPNLYGDISRMFVDYTPDKDTVTIAPLPSVALGFTQEVEIISKHNRRKQEADAVEISEQQIFPKQVGWKPWVRINKKGEVYKIYFVATGFTSQIMFGRNQNGWKNVGKITDQIVSAFGNQKLGIKGVRFTMDIYKAMPESLKPRTGRCMIFNTMRGHVNDNQHFIFLRDGHLENMGMYYSEEGVCTTALDFLPIVEVPKDILVKVRSQVRNGLTPESSLRIKRPKVQVETKAKLKAQDKTKA